MRTWKEFIKERPCINLPALRGFLSQFPGKLQKHLKSRLKRPTEKVGANREMFKLKDSKFNLEKQLQVWRKNPVWNDNQPPGIEAKKRPSIDFMEKVQKDINAGMRAILIDWLVEVAEEYRLVPNTLHLTINYDRYLSEETHYTVEKVKALAIMIIDVAIKVEDMVDSFGASFDNDCFLEPDNVMCQIQAIKRDV
ncbi:hypothetical protein L6452_32616 [Arctium lappa]|uniref:Uncharacterized protein n=1 Tax=Arctium lappa TaxID=4217 RepID=A0ACB8Z602_ARCLA|nr:hypothetical protein L6452_32616 [Arctium lappa]